MLFSRFSAATLLLTAFLAPASFASAEAPSEAPASTEMPTAEALVEASIAYHDPQGRFLTEPHFMIFKDERPGLEDRHVEVLIDVPGRRFEMLRRDEVEIRAVLGPDQCEITFNGSTEFTAADRLKHRLTCDRMTFMKNYYVYLWGLPMKLRDPGTHLGEPTLETFDGRDVYAVRVVYDAEVGSDVWYFYFDRTTSALTGYRFFKGEAEEKGEYIYLKGEYQGRDMRIPMSRAWYVFEDDRFLGTDHLIDIRDP